MVEVIASPELHTWLQEKHLYPCDIQIVRDTKSVISHLLGLKERKCPWEVFFEEKKVATHNISEAQIESILEELAYETEELLSLDDDLTLDDIYPFQIHALFWAVWQGILSESVIETQLQRVEARYDNDEEETDRTCIERLYWGSRQSGVLIKVIRERMSKKRIVQ